MACLSGITLVSLVSQPWSEGRTWSLRRANYPFQGLWAGRTRQGVSGESVPHNLTECFVFISYLWRANNYADCPGGSVDKGSTCDAGDPGSNPRLGRSPGEENDKSFQYSCLENPMDRGAWRAQSMRSQRVVHNWATKPLITMNKTMSGPVGIKFSPQGPHLFSHIRNFLLLLIEAKEEEGVGIFLFIIPWALEVRSAPCWVVHLTSSGKTHLQRRFGRMHSLTTMSISLTEQLTDEEPEIVTFPDLTLSHLREDGWLGLSEGGIPIWTAHLLNAVLSVLPIPPFLFHPLTVPSFTPSSKVLVPFSGNPTYFPSYILTFLFPLLVLFGKLQCLWPMLVLGLSCAQFCWLWKTRFSLVGEGDIGGESDPRAVSTTDSCGR